MHGDRHIYSTICTSSSYNTLTGGGDLHNNHMTLQYAWECTLFSSVMWAPPLMVIITPNHTWVLRGNGSMCSSCSSEWKCLFLVGECSAFLASGSDPNVDDEDKSQEHKAYLSTHTIPPCDTRYQAMSHDLTTRLSFHTTKQTIRLVDVQSVHYGRRASKVAERVHLRASIINCACVGPLCERGHQ